MNKVSRYVMIFLVCIFLFNMVACKNIDNINNYEFVIFRNVITGEKENISNEERNNKLIEDLDYLKEAFLEFPSNFNNLRVEDFKEKIEELKINLINLSDLEFFIELQKILTMLREGHISLLKNQSRMYLQLETILIGDDIHIKSSHIDDDFQYGKLLKINEVDIFNIKRKYRSIVPSDNYSGFIAGINIKDIDLLKGLNIIDNTNKVDITLEKNGNIKTFTLKPFVSDNYYTLSSLGVIHRSRKQRKEIIEKYINEENVDDFIPKIQNAYNFIKNIDKKSIIFNYNCCLEDVNKSSSIFLKN